MYVCVYVVRRYVRTYVRMYVCMYVCMSVLVSVCLSVCLSVFCRTWWWSRALCCTFSGPVQMPTTTATLPDLSGDLGWDALGFRAARLFTGKCDPLRGILVVRILVLRGIFTSIYK